MDTCLVDESTLFNDLTWIAIRMKDASFAEVQAVIEERFRDYLRSRAPEENGVSLEITMTWTLPEGPESWPLYTTRYALREDAPAK